MPRVRRKVTMHLKTFTASVLAISLAATGAFASVPDEVAARLGNDLTPMGSERAGNAAGTIPAWDGGLDTIPANVNYDPALPQPDPFSSDPILFTIDASNAAQYADNLTPGYVAMMARYPTFHMNVYQSRRTCAYPDFIYAASERNARVGELLSGGAGLTGSLMSAPFPIPSAGLEIVWDHTLRYRSHRLARQFAAAPVTPAGGYVLTKVQDDVIFPYSDPAATSVEELNNISLLYIANTVAPARSAGSVILVHDPLDQTINTRQAWQYSPGTRRVRRAPNISYDNPGTNSDGLSTSDAFDGYNGAPDRYDWRVVGKSERYVNYNSYNQGSAPYDQLIQAGHLNPDLIRYELHRVWTVEATLRANTRHVYSRRVKHFDEDSNGLTTAELYDSRGELWRVQEMATQQAYHAPICGQTAETVYDLQNGRYLALGLRNEEVQIDYFADYLTPERYTPGHIRRMGTR